MRASWPSSTARVWPRRCASSGGDPGPRRPRAATYAALDFSTDTSDPARGALLAANARSRDGDRDDAAVLRAASGRRCPTSGSEELLDGEGRRRGPRLLSPPPAQRPPLPRSPALRARGEDPRREVAHRRARLVAPVRGADLGDRGRAARAGEGPGATAERRERRRRVRSTSRSATSCCPTASCAAPPPRRSRRRSRPACARARSCSTRCSPTRRPTIACAATRTGWPRATSPTKPATSPCRR